MYENASLWSQSGLWWKVNITSGSRTRRIQTCKLETCSNQMTSQITRATTCLTYCLHIWHNLTDDDAFINAMSKTVFDVHRWHCGITLKPLNMRRNYWSRAVYGIYAYEIGIVRCSMNGKNATVMPQRVLIPVTLLRQTQFCKPSFETRLVLNLPTIIFRSDKKQKKARKSRKQDMLPDIENSDITRGGNSLDRDESLYSNLGRRPESSSYGNLLNQNGQSHSKSPEAEIRSYAPNGHSARRIDSSSEYNIISGELNQRFSQAMEDFMSTVSSQIQRAIDEAISDQILPQIQAALRSGHRQMPERRWVIPARKKGFSSEEALNRRFRRISRNECNRDSNVNEILDNTCDMVTGIFSNFSPDESHHDQLQIKPLVITTIPSTPPCLQQNQLPQWPYKTQSWNGPPETQFIFSTISYPGGSATKMSNNCR